MADKYKQPAETEMTNAVERARLINVDVDANANKFWDAWVLPNGDFYCEYGRVRDNRGDCRHDYYDLADTHAASSHLAKKIKEKIRKGYAEQKAIASGIPNGNGNSGKKVSSGDLKSIATKQIQGDIEVKKLVEWLVGVNIHQITSHTNISFNVESGMFQTPLGTLVTDEAISDARVLLDDMSDFVQKRDWDNRSFKSHLGDYLQLIPQDVGRTRGWHETFLAGSNALQQQNDILDSLSASLLQASTTPKTKTKTASKKVEQVFNVTLKPVFKGSSFDRVKKKYNGDKGMHSDVKDYDVHAVWTVEISTVRSSYKTDGAKVGGVKQLWHGTKASNLLSIFKGGLIIPPSSSSQVTGRMFGNGLYFSDDSTKAIRYATGGWGGGGNISRVFMFMADVAMGKSFSPSGYQYGGFKVPSGYDSCFAKAGTSVRNNEMIVYRTSQADLVYLVEFKKNRRY